MAKREISGFTFFSGEINGGEHVDEDGYRRCNKCNDKTILVYPIGEWEVDSEPFKSDETIEDEEMQDGFDVGEVTGHFCRKCNILTSISYNFP